MNEVPTEHLPNFRNLVITEASRQTWTDVLNHLNITRNVIDFIRSINNVQEI